jgi:cathepsin L
MKTLALILAFAYAANALSVDQHFELFKSEHHKTYRNSLEHVVRRKVFRDNFNLIEKHNAEYLSGKHTYTLAVNQFADMTHEEFLAERTSSQKKIHKAKPSKPVQVDTSNIPAAVDWRDEGYVTYVKDQKQCGSCWTFSAVGSMEGQHFKATGNLIPLSEQNLLDCVHPYSDGCNGGLMDDAFEYAIKNGIMGETAYPYEAKDQHCAYNNAEVVATFSDYIDVPWYSESGLTEALANVGPVSVAIDASLASFQFYSSGVYDPIGCSSTRLDHGVLAVGYGTDNGKDYYIVKNSWGAAWGQAGYIWMARNANNKCGIATEASYVLV